MFAWNVNGLLGRFAKPMAGGASSLGPNERTVTFSFGLAGLRPAFPVFPFGLKLACAPIDREDQAAINAAPFKQAVPDEQRRMKFSIGLLFIFEPLGSVRFSARNAHSARISTTATV
jgi:hypothetical protein